MEPLPHLPLVLVASARARIQGGGKRDAATMHNARAGRTAHAAALTRQFTEVVDVHERALDTRRERGLPDVVGLPVLLKVDTGLDLDELRDKLNFELVAEEADGFVIVATESIQLTRLRELVADFAQERHGSAVIAQVHELYGPSTEERLRRTLGDLYDAWWPRLRENEVYILDVGVACSGTIEVPGRPGAPKPRGPRESERRWERRTGDYQKKLAAWEDARKDAYRAWDELLAKREGEFMVHVGQLGGEILGTASATPDQVGDSFTVRVRVSGIGARDLILNHPHVFEVSLPDEFIGRSPPGDDAGAQPGLVVLPPAEGAPTVGILDSGIQEGHRLLAPAIDRASSLCLLPGAAADAIADEVKPSGHGTRVAGAVLWGDELPKAGEHRAAAWLRNVRVLGADLKMPVTLPPPTALRWAIRALLAREPGTRLYNHSINADAPCRTAWMSAWAAEIDARSHDDDVLVVQSCGNLPQRGHGAQPGLLDHLAAGRPYPDYFEVPSSRLANPAQSLQALTVGSVARSSYDDGDLRSMAGRFGEPSAFTRVGPGLWGVIKPEVVELGGDLLLLSSNPPRLGTPRQGVACYPELVRATLHGGPATAQDAVGTSYAAPLVTRIAAALEARLPSEPTLLYRALIAQSARWPAWADTLFASYRAEKDAFARSQRNAKARAKRAATPGRPASAPESVDDTALRELERRLGHVPWRIGYGLPDLERATASAPTRVTLVTTGDRQLRAGNGHVYVVPVPQSLAREGHDTDLLVEVTLSYSAAPRRTRRTPKRYLAVWLDWKTSNLGESRASFEARALVDQIGESDRGDGLPWTLGAQPNHGQVKAVSRSTGTLQKDWAVVPLRKLASELCVAVVGHKGHSLDPYATARYTLAVSFEVVGSQVAIYEEVRTRVEALVEVDAEVEVEATA